MAADRVTIPSAPAPASPATAPAVTVKATPISGSAPRSSDGRQLDPLQHAKVEISRDPVPAAPAAPADADRPTWLPAKFKSPEDLAQAYASLEQKLGGAPIAPTGVAQAAPGSDAGGGSAAPVGAPIQPPAPAPGDLQERLKQEYAQTGQISAASRAEFTQRTGLDAGYIDHQIAYIKAQGAQATDMAVKRLGGEGAVQELLAWAGKRLSQGEREAFNRAAYSGDEGLAQLAVDGLAAKYEAEVGRSPRLMAGRKPQDEYGGLVPFQSHAEWTAARRDARYKKDPAYRAEVEQRMVMASRMGLI